MRYAILGPALLFLGFESLLSITCGSVFAQESPGLPSIEEIRSITAKRIGRTKAMKLWFEGQTVWIKEKTHSFRTRELIPSENAALAIKGEIVISGGSYRLDVVRDLMNVDTGAVAKGRRKTSVYKEGIGRSLSSDPQGNDRNGEQSKGDWDGLGEPVSNALVLAFVPDSRYLEGDAMTVLRREMTRDGERIVVGNTDFDNPKRRGATREEFHLDPRRDYLPTQWVVMYPNGRILSARTMEYSAISPTEYAPAKATHTLMEGEDISQTAEARATKVEVDQPIDPSTFILTFPPGTHVIDRMTKVEYVIPGGGEAEANGRTSKWIADVVSQAKVEPSKASPPAPKPVVADAPSTPPAAPSAPRTRAESQPASSGTESNSFWWILGAVLLVGAVAGAMLARRGKSR